MSTTTIDAAILSTFGKDINALRETVTHLAKKDGSKLTAEQCSIVIGMKLEGPEHATATFHDLYRGKCTSENIQALLDIAYPGCTKRTAAHHLCRFRNPEKYSPKHTTRYPVAGGRGRIRNANIGNITDEQRNALGAFL